MNVILYSRLSPDDAAEDDIAAQEAQLMQDAEAAGFCVVAAFRDANVTGAVPPMDRPDFQRAVKVAQAWDALLFMRDWSRFSRQNPADAATALLDCPVHVHVARDNLIPQQTREAQEDSPVSAGMTFFSFFGPWQYRAAAIKNSRNTAQAFSDGLKQTKSGKAPHRPIKISDDEAHEAWDNMQADKALTLRREAHNLSERRGAFKPGIEAKARRDRMVSHKALARAFERCGLGQKQSQDERDSSQGGEGSDSNRALSPGEDGSSGGRKSTPGVGFAGPELAAASAHSDKQGREQA